MTENVLGWPYCAQKEKRVQASRQEVLPEKVTSSNNNEQQRPRLTRQITLSEAFKNVTEQRASTSAEGAPNN
ncbi:hypothetical protein M513_11976 [Trichuris suis]|uniref:Uncharacterized protein n=1 Tax=Trichuris suis TaxID=68888 RepID=A0A085LQC1_9BILA|nr:hypothetical protein M513_11976 [Trichuris suis]